MTRLGRIGLLAALLTALVAAPQAVRAEVRADSSNGKINTLIMGITDGVDPIPQIVWEPHNPQPDDAMLNPDGAERSDGVPHMAIHPTLGWPVTVWAYSTPTVGAPGGFQSDVAVTVWDADEWGGIDAVTTTLESEADPQLFVEEDVTVHVVWWVDGADAHVILQTHPGDSQHWTLPYRVTPFGEVARRPSVAVFQGEVWVAYERDDPLGGPEPTEVVVGRWDGIAFTEEVTIPTQYDDGVFPRLHLANDRMWVDWRNGEDEYGWRLLRKNDWGPVHTVTWTDDGWVGREMVRRVIANQVGRPWRPISIPDPPEIP